MRDVRAQVTDVLREGVQLLESLTDEQTRWRPNAGTWSVGECVDHVTMSTQSFRARIEEAVALSRQRGWTYAGPGRVS